MAISRRCEVVLSIKGRSLVILGRDQGERRGWRRQYRMSKPRPSNDTAVCRRLLRIGKRAVCRAPSKPASSRSPITSAARPDVSITAATEQSTDRDFVVSLLFLLPLPRGGHRIFCLCCPDLSCTAVSAPLSGSDYTGWRGREKKTPAEKKKLEVNQQPCPCRSVIRLRKRPGRSRSPAAGFCPTSAHHPKNRLSATCNPSNHHSAPRKFPGA